MAFTEGGRTIGETKIQGANTIYDVKRVIGKNFNDTSLQSDKKNWPFTIVSVDGKPYYQIAYKGATKQLSPEEIIAMILSKMKENAEDYLKQPVHCAVISIPAHFGEIRRLAVDDAAKIAGFEEIRLVNGILISNYPIHIV